MTMAMKQGFAPPEQYRTKGQGPWTDVYGICAAMYYCLTGKKPVQALDRLMGTELPTLMQLGVELPAYQEAAILKGLELSVENRFKNMDELANMLYPEKEECRPEEHVQEKEPMGFRQMCIYIFNKLKERRDVS